MFESNEKYHTCMGNQISKVGWDCIEFLIVSWIILASVKETYVN